MAASIADRGYRGRSRWGDTALVIPGVPKKSDSAHIGEAIQYRTLDRKLWF